MFKLMDYFMTSSLIKTVFLTLCFVFLAFTSGTTVETSGDSIGVIVGSVTGVVLLVAAAEGAGILIYKKYQRI